MLHNVVLLTLRQSSEKRCHLLLVVLHARHSLADEALQHGVLLSVVLLEQRLCLFEVQLITDLWHYFSARRRVRSRWRATRSAARRRRRATAPATSITLPVVNLGPLARRLGAVGSTT